VILKEEDLREGEKEGVFDAEAVLKGLEGKFRVDRSEVRCCLALGFELSV
jgi:hypothetical protein